MTAQPGGLHEMSKANRTAPREVQKPAKSPGNAYEDRFGKRRTGVDVEGDTENVDDGSAVRLGCTKGEIVRKFRGDWKPSVIAQAFLVAARPGRSVRRPLR